MPVIKHVVFLEIVNDPKHVSSIRQGLADVSKQVAGCSNFQFGKCEDSNYHYFCMDFDSIKSRDAYLAHPEHERVAKEVIIPHLKDGLKSAIVFDHEVTPHRLQEASTSGYVLIKETELNEALQELINYCDKISGYEPLENLSIEKNLAPHSYAVHIHRRKDVKAFTLRSASLLFQQKLEIAKPSSEAEPKKEAKEITEGPRSKL